MTRDEATTLVSWAEREGWNPGRNDAALFWELDPDGFLALEEQGQMVGGGAIIRHHALFGFMGLFIVQPAARGRRLGERLWHARRDRLLARLAAGATIGLDGVDAMTAFYERGGFRPFTRHRRFRWQGTAPPHDARGLCDARTIALAQLAEVDRRCFPGDRRAFLAAWIAQPGAHALAWRTEDRVRGFGVMRPCGAGWKIGPLFAEDAGAADALWSGLCARAGGGPTFLDVPDNNPDALALCAARGMTEVFGCVRMYLGPPPAVEHRQIFGVTTLEVG
jgi:GNAT superfamily N-acetyltransferase